MNKSVYGHQTAKSKIMNTVSQWISNPNSMSQILAIQGPPGIGKTSLVKDGVEGSREIGAKFTCVVNKTRIILFYRKLKKMEIHFRENYKGK